MQEKYQNGFYVQYRVFLTRDAQVTTCACVHLNDIGVPSRVRVFTSMAKSCWARACNIASSIRHTFPHNDHRRDTHDALIKSLKKSRKTTVKNEKTTPATSKKMRVIFQAHNENDVKSPKNQR